MTTFNQAYVALLPTLLCSYEFKTEVNKMYAITNVGRFVHRTSVYHVSYTVYYVQADGGSNITSGSICR